MNQGTRPPWIECPDCVAFRPAVPYATTGGSAIRSSVWCSPAPSVQVRDATDAVFSTPRPLPGSKVSEAEVSAPFQLKVMDVSPSAS